MSEEEALSLKVEDSDNNLKTEELENEELEQVNEVEEDDDNEVIDQDDNDINKKVEIDEESNDKSQEDEQLEEELVRAEEEIQQEESRQIEQEEEDQLEDQEDQEVVNNNVEDDDQIDEEDDDEPPQKQEESDDGLGEVEEDDYEDEEDEILNLKRHKRDDGASNNHESSHNNNNRSSGMTRAERGEQEHREDEPYTIQDTNDAETRRKELEQRMNEAIKSKSSRRRNNQDIDLEQMQDGQIQSLKNQMQEAAYDDAKCISERSGVAMNKLKLLPRVKDVLLKKNLADSVLDNNLLEAVRVWLEPLPDGSLPAFEIQKIIFDSLQDLDIKPHHLRESALGKVVLFYQKSKRVEPGIKRIADKLVGNWTRPILKVSDNYAEKEFQSREFDISRLIESRKRKIINNGPVEKTLYQQTAERRQRAAAPAPRSTAYKYAPRVEVSSRMSESQRMAIGSSLNKDEQYRRINSKMLNRNKKIGAKKTGVSIEGRNMPL